jgi:ferric iron reductase protein FhuF
VNNTLVLKEGMEKIIKDSHQQLQNGDFFNWEKIYQIGEYLVENKYNMSENDFKKWIEKTFKSQKHYAKFYMTMYRNQNVVKRLNMNNILVDNQTKVHKVLNKSSEKLSASNSITDKLIIENVADYVQKYISWLKRDGKIK